MNTLHSQDAATPLEDSTTKLIPLTQGKFASVDAADYEWLNQWKWCVFRPGNVWYAVRNQARHVRPRLIYMHRAIMGNPIGMEVDHRDGNGLNNSRYNLRTATPSQNHCNRGPQRDNVSGFKGVSWNSKERKWAAFIKINRRTKYLGYFLTKEAAASAYIKAAQEIHGEFARIAPFGGTVSK